VKACPTGALLGDLEALTVPQVEAQLQIAATRRKAGLKTQELLDPRVAPHDNLIPGSLSGCFRSRIVA
jgi:hypothetical protein